MNRASKQPVRRGPLFHIRRWEVRRHLPSARDEDVVNIGRAVDRLHVLSPWFWVWMIISFAGVFLISAWIAEAVRLDLGSGIGVVYQLATFGIAMTTYMLPLMWRERFLMRRVAREYGYSICMQCGYDLRASPEHATRCPECGAECGDQK